MALPARIALVCPVAVVISRFLLVERLFVYALKMPRESDVDARTSGQSTSRASPSLSESRITREAGFCSTPDGVRLHRGRRRFLAGALDELAQRLDVPRHDTAVSKRPRQTAQRVEERMKWARSRRSRRGERKCS